MDRQLVRQHRQPRRLHVAAREVRRATSAQTAAPARGTFSPTSASTANTPAVSKRVPTGSIFRTEVRRRLRPGRRLQRLRLLRRRLSVRRDRSPAGRRAGRSSARSATTGRRPGCSRRARRRVRPSRFSSATSTSLRRAPSSGWSMLQARGHRRTRSSTTRVRRASAARTRSSSCAATPPTTTCPRIRRCRRCTWRAPGNRPRGPARCDARGDGRGLHVGLTQAGRVQSLRLRCVFSGKRSSQFDRLIMCNSIDCFSPARRTASSSPSRS